MFNNPSESDPNLDEGVVTEVDTQRRLCRVKTMRGQNLNSVHFMGGTSSASRGGIRYTPCLGDRVAISSGLGYPVIQGVLPKLQPSEGAFPINIDTGENLIDTGSFSSSSDAVTFDSNAPLDMAAGDILVSSNGGGIIGVLRGGSILLRSSRLSEIFISKWDDLVRVVSRNWQHFTDASTDVIYNLKNRVYRYSGYAGTFGDARTENYKYNQYIGDVSLAEVAKGDQSTTDTPAVDDRIFKEEIVTGGSSSDHQLMKREIHLDGTQDIVIKNADGSLYTRILTSNSGVTIMSSSTGDATFTKTYLTKDEVTVTYKDINVVKINTNQINLSKGGTAIVNLSDSGIDSTFAGGEIKMHSAGIDSTFGGHFVKISSSGVALG